MLTREVPIADLQVGGARPLLLIAGPCVIEDEGMLREVALHLREVTARLGLSYVFKASYDKANRSSGDSFRGPGLRKGLEMLARLKQDTGVPLLSDVHSVDQVAAAAEVLDVLQVPAFLCRQTDLLEAAGRAGKPVNVKKGQFMAPWDMKWVLAKIQAVGNDQVLLTERGASFGYNNLVTDLRSLALMRQLGWPVVFDGTHSAQLPGGAGSETGGMREMVPYLVRGAVAAGVDGLFLEVHPEPERARSDRTTQLPLAEIESLLRSVTAIDAAIRSSSSVKA